MLGRRREQILIIGGLVGLNLLLGWLGTRLWKDYRSRAEWLHAGASAETAGNRAAGSKLTGQPPSFVDIVDRNVFSALRGAVPAQPQEEAKAPKLPLLFGTMDLGNGRFALMTPGDQPSGPSQRVLPGEEIGGYKLVSIGTSNVVVEWQEKKVTVDIFESAHRSSGGMDRGAAARASAAARGATASAPVTTVGSGHGAPTTPPTGPPGTPPNAPLGTVVGGKQKVEVPTPFGTLTQWQDVRQGGSQPPQTGGPNK